MYVRSDIIRWNVSGLRFNRRHENIENHMLGKKYVKIPFIRPGLEKKKRA